MLLERDIQKRAKQFSKCYYWTKYDQQCLENGRKDVIADRIFYYPASYNTRQVVINILEKTAKRNKYINLDSNKIEIAIAEIKKYLLRKSIQSLMNKEPVFHNFIKNGTDNINDLVIEVLSKYTLNAIGTIEKEARVLLKEEIQSHINLDNMGEIIKNELKKKPIAFLNNDIEIPVNLILAFLENSKTKKYILNNVIESYSLGEDIIASKKYCIAIKRAIKDRIVYYVDNVLIKTKYLEFLQ